MAQVLALVASTMPPGMLRDSNNLCTRLWDFVMDTLRFLSTYSSSGADIPATAYPPLSSELTSSSPSVLELAHLPMFLPLCLYKLSSTVITGMMCICILMQNS